MVKDKLAYMAQKEVFEDGDEGGYDLTHPIRKDTRSCFSEDLLLFITVLLLDDSEYRQLKRQGKLPRVETVLQIDVAKILKRLIEVRVAQYPTTADEDQKLLADVGDDTTSRKAMAVQVRLGEKTILEECRDVLDVYV
ncbi:Ribosomal lysine N-methyltransferase 4 [Cryomyces antarcticus]|uniref:Ribosomal lysine N-methyltransferase 4 n=1 Tax=Cryomyces antarcticus TaxID=329879 RepID=A0ABR0LQ65_9PEZI|nr:Ribosomal lysine N-methyltransferase 4 [Cryomyces antarcticus]